ncbi:hypothetical protein [Chitinophaga sp. S165]|uniref:hypothetical protein n=1 Tax=Chitinophaga sp. S165 TaxID=2135462 RepID=UPI000D71656C|nr:hypothetical protein [Chitinophaga sp. S165]PWV55534.1 hypothetical protein C7475_10140 [Chitinophaga sp. S165]
MQTEILVAVIAAIAAVVTAITSAVINIRNSQKIELLKNELERKKVKDQEIMKWLISYKTDMVDQHLVSLKDFLTILQYSKDRLRNIFINYDSIISEERAGQLQNVQHAIIEKYSMTRYYFDNTVWGDLAHNIKSNLLSIIGELSSTNDLDRAMITSLIHDVSVKQNELHKGMEQEILQLYQSLQNSLS